MLKQLSWARRLDPWMQTSSSTHLTGAPSHLRSLAEAPRPSRVFSLCHLSHDRKRMTSMSTIHKSRRTGVRVHITTFWAHPHQSLPRPSTYTRQHSRRNALLEWQWWLHSRNRVRYSTTPSKYWATISRALSAVRSALHLTRTGEIISITCQRLARRVSVAPVRFLCSSTSVGPHQSKNRNNPQ